MTDTDRCCYLIVMFLLKRWHEDIDNAQANWSRDIAPFLRAMGMRPITAAQLKLVNDGYIRRVAPDTYRLTPKGAEHHFAWRGI